MILYAFAAVLALFTPFYDSQRLHLLWRVYNYARKVDDKTKEHTMRHLGPDEYSFKPPFWLRPAMMQTAIASQHFRKWGANPVEDQANAVVFTCSDGARLQGSYSVHPQSRGLAIFLHGWEGSENSTYVLSCARFLYKAGLSVFRLNFRDHGDTHHLNEDVFHSARLREVQEAVEQARALEPGGPAYLIGFSLGGNFALRIAREEQTRKDKTRGNSGLDHIFSISPVINPGEASPKIDKNPLIRRYFYKKWTKSLSKKQAAFPAKYDFSGLNDHKTVMGLTEEFLPAYTEYEDPDDYFKAYEIGESDLADCMVPTSIVMAWDDPVVPARHVDALKTPPNIRKIMLERGGHNGFFQSLSGPTWYDDYILQVIGGR